uniref:Uncharacterized protein n=1 Tax=Anopheles darlingi TaxID=43151 RepID=A0A2M4CWJ4_ANODA
MVMATVTAVVSRTFVAAAAVPIVLAATAAAAVLIVMFILVVLIPTAVLGGAVMGTLLRCTAILVSIVLAIAIFLSSLALQIGPILAGLFVGAKIFFTPTIILRGFRVVLGVGFFLIVVIGWFIRVILFVFRLTVGITFTLRLRIKECPATISEETFRIVGDGFHNFCPIQRLYTL